MLEIVVERWQGATGRVDYRWSLWRDGKRAAMGGPFAEPEPCLDEARGRCREAFGRPPDRVTEL